MNKKIVFTFGRFNPPTTGHFLLATKVKQEASRRGADHIIYGSSSQDAARNPLNSRQKLRFMKKVLKGFNVKIDSGVANPYDALSKLDKEGYTDVVMVVGADRVNEFRRGMKRYIGPNKLYKFKSFEVVSAGERDPDADDVTGMSASKMRAVAKEGNIAAFKLGVPQHVSTNDVSAFFKAVQTGMKIKPFVAENWFDYDEFVEFLEENDLNKFDMSGVGIDIPAVNNRVWGTEGIKKSAKKKKKKKVEVDEEIIERTIASTISSREKEMLGSALNATTGYLENPNTKRASADNINTFQQPEITKAMQYLQQKRMAGRHQTTYNLLNKSMGNNITAGVEHEEETELSEINVQQRRKMAMSAKRTAKRRARKRKMKEKRKKSAGEIKKKAKKAAISKIRSKMIKGMNWNDLSYSQREAIGERLKRKKNVIQKLAKRLLPATVKAEQERLKKVRARMTTNDPAKAVTNFEDIDHDFETEVLNESRLLSFSEASQVAAIKQKIGTGEQGSGYYSKDEDKEAKKENPKSTPEAEIFYIVKNKKTKKTQVVVKFNKAEHTPMDQGAKSSIVGSAKKASGEEDFDWRSSRSAMAKLGITKAADVGERGTSEEGGDKKTSAAAKKGKKRVKGFKDQTGQGDVEVPLTPTQKRTQANTDKAGEIRSKLDAGMAQDEWDRYQQGKEVELNQVAMQNYATDMGEKMGIAAKPPTAKQAKKLKSTKDGLFEDWHAAVDVEAAVVAVGNGCHLKETGEEMRTCLSASGISDGDIKKLAESPTLIPAAMRMLDRVGMQLPEGMQWQHTGKGLGEVTLSQTYDIAGAKNTTPKTDLRACDPKTGKCMNLSMKMGPGQLMSGQAGESIGTYRVVLDRMRGCKGKSIDKDGNETGVACTRKLGEGDKELIKRMEQITKDIKKTFINRKVSEGMGPIGWWLGKGIGGRKPSWWDRTGPGRPGMDISWEDAKGTDPNDHPEWFMEDKKELEKNMKVIQDANRDMKVIKKELEGIFSSGKFGQEIKEHVMYEAMTGCGKFCEGCCGTDICKECQSIHAATHVIVGNKDGTGGMIKEIEPPGSKMLKEMSENTTVDVRYKTTSGVKSAKGWFKEMEPGLFEKIKFMTKKEQDGIARVNSGKMKDTHPEYDQYVALAKIREQELSDEEHKRLLELIAYTGQELPKGKKHWNDLSKKQQKKILNKAEISMGGRSVNSVSGMNTTFETSGVGKIFDEVQPKFRTFLEHSGDKENGEYGIEDAMKWVGHDPGRLAEFLGLEPVIDAPHESYGDVFESEETSGKINTVTIDGKTKTIPVAKDDEYRDYQAEREEGQEDTSPEQFKKDGVNEEYKKKKVRRKMLTFTEQTENTNQEIPYEFKNSSVHGLGSFATKEINENEQIALYYLNLLNENENAPQYQRTDFCRLTNHSQHIPNVSLVENKDGNFYTYAIRDIQEGEELLIDYFRVFESILPAIKEEGEVIPEVLRWTDGYEDLEIPPDSFGDLRDELQYFSEINEAVDVVTGVEENISITGHNKRGHVIGGFYVHGGRNDPEIARKIKSIKKNFGRNLHKIEVKKHGQNIQEPELVTDSVVNTVKDKIDNFKFYTSSSQTKIRKKEKERKKKVKKYNKMVGINSEVEFDKDTELEESYDNKGLLKKGLTHAVYSKGPSGHIPEGAGAGDASASATDANRAAYLKQYGAKPEQRARRSSRTNARNKAIRSGRASVGDGKDLDHKNGNPLDNSPKNLRMVNRSFNRGRDNNKWRKTNEEHGAGEIGTKKLLKKYLKDTPYMTIKGKTAKEL